MERTWDSFIHIYVDVFVRDPDDDDRPSIIVM